MSLTALYNDIEPHTVAVLKRRMAEGWIPSGVVSSDDIRAVCRRDLSHHSHIHLFAGIGGFAFGARMAGVPDEFKLFTAGFPCQPFSNAGRRRGVEDNRYLWPQTLSSLQSHGSDVVLLENVAGIVSVAFPRERALMDIRDCTDGFRDYHYRQKEPGVLATICDQLEEAGYSVQPLIIPAVGVDAPHQRDRLWIVGFRSGFVSDAGRGRCGQSQGREVQQSGRAETVGSGQNLAHADGERQSQSQGSVGQVRKRSGDGSEDVAHPCGPQSGGLSGRTSAQISGAGEPSQNGCGNVSDAASIRLQRQRESVLAGGSAADDDWKTSQPFDERERCQWEPEPEVGRVAHGIPDRMDCLKSLGNAIVPQVAAEILRFAMAAVNVRPVFAHPYFEALNQEIAA